MGNGQGLEEQMGTFQPQEIKRLYKRFSKLDTDGSGQLEPSELFDVPELS